MTHIALLTVALVWVAGCSGADNRPPVADLGSAGAAGSTGGGSAGAGGATNTTPDPTCNEGTARECKVRLPSHAGVSNCFVGVQLCDSGKWGNCMDPADVR